MIQGRICENRNEFAHHLDLALKGVPSSQGVVKETVMMTLGLAPRVTEAVTSDMVAGWFTSVAQGAFESQYAEQTTTWEKFASTEALPSFRPTQLYELDHDIDATLLRDNGGEVVVPQTMPRIPELTPYPTFGYRASGRWVEVHKEGVRLQMSWEAFINDNWNIIGRFPKDAAFLVSRTVDAAVYGALFSLDAAAPGFNTNIIAESNATVLQARTADGAYVLRDVPKNSPLTFEALCAAIWQVRHTKVNGRYIQVPKFVLLVPPTLKPMADMVTSMTSIEHKEKDAAGATSNKTILSTTPTAGVEVVESDMVGLLGGPTQGDTNWILAPAGGRTAARRTILRTTLMGMEGVELRAAANQGTSLGGGALNATSGSFDNDDIQFRARMVTGGAVLHTDGIVASTGQGH